MMLALYRGHSELTGLGARAKDRSESQPTPPPSARVTEIPNPSSQIFAFGHRNTKILDEPFCAQQGHVINIGVQLPMEVCITITAITNVITSDSLTLPSCALVGHEPFIVQHQIDHCGFCLHLACLRNMIWSVGGRFVFIILFSWVRAAMAFHWLGAMHSWSLNTSRKA